MQEKNYPIKYWAKDDRPREKLLTRGPSALTDSELLAILIQQGQKEKSAFDLAREVLRLGNQNLNSLAKLTINELTKIKGIGNAKAVLLVAAFELGRRRQAAKPEEKELISGSADVATYFHHLLKDHDREVFAVLFLNRAHKVNHFEIISQGGITGTVADPRIILKRALEKGAISLILCHNHPSGSLKPSRADRDLTTKIKTAAGFLDIMVLDHVIVSEEGYFSFADEGIL